MVAMTKGPKPDGGRRSNEEMLYLATRAGRHIKIRVLFQVYTQKRQSRHYRFHDLHQVSMVVPVQNQDRAWELMRGIANYVEENFSDQPSENHGPEADRALPALPT